ncbi:glyoxalase-like domain protein [Duganella sp. FT94W]|uniref:Glyoxalase-like domain protein n=1 Tax=Duganella lactea TaxID=2692173 RepID=A0ABW9V9W2_9BURK|nr:VOC family protein [Duganella lactea]MYM35515.1 glyoxalase-like domain protein [Duganella lactea]
MKPDHIFIRATPGAPEAEALRAFGLTEGSGNVHPGQGTANRRFFFANAFLELLWIADAAEVASPLTAPTTLGERLCADSAASPFGICFRDAGTPSFPVFDYQPSYLPPGMSIGIASEAPLSEPMWFYLAGGKSLPPPPDHAAGLNRISAVRCTRPAVAALSAAALGSGVTFAEGKEHLLEISFDDEMRGLTHDFRPILPLIFRY